MSIETRFWAVIPAAGAGTRMQADRPKQYLQVGEKTLIEYSLNAFCRHNRISGVIVALSDDDNYWPQLPVARHEKITTTPGGKERCHSVLNCLEVLGGIAASDDWVLVHDAARPCLCGEDISLLIDRLCTDPVGGLLALPVRDTMKRASGDYRVTETVNRKGLWHALTPQMFRLQALVEALHAALEKQQLVTDESQAMELSGHHPQLIQGNPHNIKVTHKDDLSLAEMYLARMVFSSQQDNTKCE
ncbi:MAG TPA: 2-C-methyl-D-erythritol 4-phosphate cytidylyltransferase [Gammaproteobacteria bacterium]|nr:2-C-methyl-D-erythritol 4-phosphate cytidylyltransferase [Gammaproteobacteria bacterium]